MLFDNDTARWIAITRRDASADGHFIYAVKTTKIFCRPNCKARLARRANVSFFKNSEEATSAGYRACKRCKPELASSHDPQEILGRKAVELIAKRVEEMRLASCTKRPLDLKGIAKELGWTTSHFHHVFKCRVGITPKQFAKSLQVQNSSKTDVLVETSTNENNSGNVYLHELQTCLAADEVSWGPLPDAHGVYMNPEPQNFIKTNIEDNLLGVGEEFIDWDSLVCG